MSGNISVVEGLGLLFYVTNPSKSSFKSISECPDYVGQMIPYMVVLIVIEGVINHYFRSRELNIADSVTSATSGLLMTLGGMFTKLIMIQVYDYVHHHYRLTSLPWDSVMTWLTAAVLIDLGYYWFHRASHEIGVLWAVHQVHHSSQYFNLTTALRQPVLEGLGWVTHWFYLPMALLIPTSQMLVHAEFNFIYQFLIHTELIGDMGFFGLVLNTASHHRVHHGANRYCLDKNYGGWLCVWDRVFGTFQEEKPNEEIVYGLVDQPRFFNIIKHQFFYFPLLHNKTDSKCSWSDNVKKYLFGPGWFPNMNLPRLGDNNLVEEKPQRSLHVSSTSWLNHLNNLVQLLGVVFVHDYITSEYASLNLSQIVILTMYMVWTSLSIGLVYDSSNSGHSVELLRTFFFLMYFYFNSTTYGGVIQSTLITSLLTNFATIWKCP